MRRRKSIVPVAVKVELILIPILLAVLLGLVRSGYGLPDPGALFAPREKYIEYGTEPSPVIDSSVLTDTRTKNSRDLVAFVTQAWEHRWGYVWGTFGYELTERQLAAKLQQYPDTIGPNEDFIRENWLGSRTADCIGLIKAYCWYDPDTGIRYNTGTMPDCDTEQLFEAASEKGSIDSIPEIPGLLVYARGHVGVYIGDGYVIDAMSTEAGVVKTKLSERGFTHWLKCPYIEYI